MGFIKTWIDKSRKVKSRGIALTHRDQGYSANNRPISLLMKSAEDKELTVEIVKALEQVQLKISMEEFLKKFFDMWSSDAELLTKVLGFKTELEYDAESNPSDEWLQDWNKRHQEYLDDKLTTITLIKKANGGEDLSLQEQVQLIETRKSFESGCETLSVSFETDLQKSKNTEGSGAGKPEGGKTPVDVTLSSVPSGYVKGSPGAKTTHTKETPVEKEVDVTKSAAFIELQKAMTAQTELMKAMQAQVADAQEIIKAQKAAKRAVALEKAAGFAFVAEGQREAVADVIENTTQATLVSVLEKAASLLQEKDSALAAKDAEIEEIKKSFADGKGIGANGDLTDVAKGSQAAQARLDEVIKARKLELEKSKTTA